MDDQDGVGLGFVRVGDVIDEKEETDDVTSAVSSSVGLPGSAGSADFRKIFN